MLPLQLTSIVGILFTHVNITSLADVGNDVMDNDKRNVVLKILITLP
jgi:hypothetical protein